MKKMTLKDILVSKYFYLGVAALFILTFLAQNNRPVTIDFFFWELASANLLVLLLLFFAIGGVVGFFGNQVYRLRAKSKQKAKEQRIKRGSSANYPHEPPPTPIQ